MLIADADPAPQIPTITNNSICVKVGPGANLGVLKDSLYRNADYKLLTPRAWGALSRWYGASIALPRCVIDVSALTSPVPAAGGAGGETKAHSLSRVC